MYRSHIHTHTHTGMHMCAHTHMEKELTWLIVDTTHTAHLFAASLHVIGMKLTLQDFRQSIAEQLKVSLVTPVHPPQQ